MSTVRALFGSSGGRVPIAFTYYMRGDRFIGGKSDALQVDIHVEPPRSTMLNSGNWLVLVMVLVGGPKNDGFRLPGLWAMLSFNSLRNLSAMSFYKRGRRSMGIDKGRHLDRFVGIAGDEARGRPLMVPRDHFLEIKKTNAEKGKTKPPRTP